MSKSVDSNSSLFDYDWNNTANWNEDSKCIIPEINDYKAKIPKDTVKQSTAVNRSGIIIRGDIMMHSLDYIIIFIIINYNDTLSGDNEIISNKKRVVVFYRVYIYTIRMSFSLKYKRLDILLFIIILELLNYVRKSLIINELLKNWGSFL